MRILGIIPARYASTRFPAKALALINGKTMVQRVWEQTVKCKALSKVVVATDNINIQEHVLEIGGEVVMTSELHTSGTDRCQEAVEQVGEDFDFIINIQGDEPFILPEQIALLAEALNPQTELATLIKKIEDPETLFNPNTPKVIFNKTGEAIYFSRHPIPYLRGMQEEAWLSNHTFYKHIGIYAYRRDVLKKISQLPPSDLERSESLEQLRWLENGYKINVAITTYESFGIDTAEDLERIKKLYGEQNRLH